jgi:hypothetical protein
MSLPLRGMAKAEWADGRAAVLYAPARVRIARLGTAGTEMVTLPAAWESEHVNLADLLNENAPAARSRGKMIVDSPAIGQ